MARIPRWLLTHRITVEPYEGANAHGVMYGPAGEERAFVDARRTFNESGERSQRDAGATIYVQLNTRANTGARITHRGHVSTAVEVLPRDGGGLPTPDHVEITTE